VSLAGLARFVIVDLSGPSVPQEITATVDLHEIPFVPILERERKDWSMFRDFLVKERVLEPVRFTDACTGTAHSIRSVRAVPNSIFCPLLIFWQMRGEAQRFEASEGTRGHAEPQL
jgi:hypothetical protein